MRPGQALAALSCVSLLLLLVVAAGSSHAMPLHAPDLIVRAQLEQTICSNLTFVDQTFGGNADRCCLAVEWMVTLSQPESMVALRELSVLQGPLLTGCSVGDGLFCAGTIATCVPSCTRDVGKCLTCFGGAWAQCCPCLKNIIKSIKC